MRVALRAASLGAVCLALLAAGRATAQAPGAPALVVAQSLTLPFALAAHRFADVDGDGRMELVAVGEDGAVRTFAWDAGAGKVGEAPRGTLTLPAPDRSALAIADVLGAGRPQLVVLSPAGATAYPATPGGSFAAQAVALAPRARFTIRLGAPRFVDIVRDVNDDGAPDLIVPSAQACEIWLGGRAEAPDDAVPASAPAVARFRKAATIPIDSDMSRSTANGALSDRLTSELTLPRLDIRDLNGDGREDLAVEDGKVKSFHLQRDDGTIPPIADVSVDLGIFRDTTPDSDLRPGRTLAGLDKTLFYATDLDADGIPDYIIAHRRKVWVFHGKRTGPQFTEPSNVLKTADDVTTIVPAKLDGDATTDMIVVKVEVPTVATLMTGLFGDWDVDIHALGYLHGADRKFQTTPALKSTLSVRLPSILEIVRNPQAILQRFSEATQSERLYSMGDLDGDGARDVALLAKDGRTLEAYRGTSADAAASQPVDDDGGWIRRVLFDDPDRVWDLDRIIHFIANQSERRIERMTARRVQMSPLVLRDAAHFAKTSLECADLDGDGRQEIALRYHDLKSGAASFDIVRMR
jgi:hypothetical protein